MSDFVAPPPPPPLRPTGVTAKAGPIGWAAVVAGVLGLLALFLPWYSPKLSKPLGGVSDLGSPYHAWSGFFFLVAGPLLLIVFAVLWLQALRGSMNSRFAGSDNPLRSLSLQSAGAGAIALVLGLLSFLIMKNHYKDWDAASAKARQLGSSIEKNPQFGLYALLIGAVVLIAVGVAGLVRPTVAAAPAQDGGLGVDQSGQGESGPQYGAFGDGSPQPGGFGAPSGGFPPAGPPQS